MLKRVTAKKYPQAGQQTGKSACQESRLQSDEIAQEAAEQRTNRAAPNSDKAGAGACPALQPGRNESLSNTDLIYLVDQYHHICKKLSRD